MLSNDLKLDLLAENLVIVGTAGKPKNYKLQHIYYLNL